MTENRDLAERLLVEMAPLRQGTPEDLAREIFALIAAFEYEANRAAPVPSLADGEWRDAPRAPYVPKVGDVVRLTDWPVEELRVVVAVHGDELALFDITGRHGRIGGLYSARVYTYLRPATAAERVAAGLPPEAGVVASVPSVPTHKDAAPASKPVPVDREGLAAVLRRAWIDSPPGVPWGNVADAAIAYMKGGAS